MQNPIVIGKPSRLWSYFLLALALIPAFGAAQSGQKRSAASGAQVVTLGRPMRSRVQGDVVTFSPPAVSALTFSPDGMTLLAVREQASPAAGENAGAIEVWSLAPPRLLRTVGSREYGYTAAALSPNGKILAALMGGYLFLWDWQSGKKLYEATINQIQQGGLTLEDAGTCGAAEDTLAWLPDNTLFYTGMKHKRLMHLDPTTLKLQPMELTFPNISAVALSSDGKQLALERYQQPSGPDGIVLFDVASASKIRALPLETGKMFGLAFFPDGKRIFTIEGERDRAIDLADGKTLYSLPAGPDFKPVAFSPDGRWLATADSKAVTVWKADTGAKWAELPLGQEYVTALTFAPDSRRLAIGFGDSTIQLWTLR